MNCKTNERKNDANEALVALYNGGECKEWYGGDLVHGVHPARLEWVLRDAIDILETLSAVTDPRAAEVRGIASRMLVGRG